MDKQQLQDYINRLQADCDSLIGKYGQGVRPSWVSCDLALNYDKMERAQAELDLLDIESPCDDWAGGGVGKGQL